MLFNDRMLFGINDSSAVPVPRVTRSYVGIIIGAPSSLSYIAIHTSTLLLSYNTCITYRPAAGRYRDY